MDNPNRVLRRLLRLPPAAIDRDRTALAPSSVPRVSKGSLLPLPEYDVPILQAISEAGGSAPRSTVLVAVELMLRDRLTDLDRTPTSTGVNRWRSRVDQARSELVKRGLLESSRSGVWTLTEAGIAYLDRRLKSKKAAAERGPPDDRGNARHPDPRRSRAWFLAVFCWAWRWPSLSRDGEEG